MFVICFVVYSFFDILKDCQADGVLPEGVIEVEITDWTKTREPSEIGQGEKKMNSHADLGELNNGISSQEVDQVEGLYDSTMNLMDMNILNSNRISNAQEVITGGKVLRTIPSVSNKKIRYDTRTLKQYLKSDEPINWQNGRTSWNLYTSMEEKSVEWRMMSGKFNLSSEDIKLLNGKKYQVVLGIPVDNELGFELIMPFNDIVSVFVNNNNTSINYTDKNLVGEYLLNGNLVKYRLNSGCKKLSYHESLTEHTSWHVDMDVLKDNNCFMRDTLINNVKLGENEIDFLVGTFAGPDCTALSSYGFSKLNLYLIKIPTVEVYLDFYEYDGDEIVYFDDEYKPCEGEEVYFRVRIKNLDSGIDVEDVDLAMSIGDKFLFKFNSEGIFYKGTRLGEHITSLPRLSEIVLSSEDFKYTVTRENCLKGIVYTTVHVGGNYMMGNIPYFMPFEKITSTVDNRLKNYVDSDVASLDVSCEIEGGSGEETVCLQLKSSDDFCNIFLKNGHTSNVRKLGLGKDYNISVIALQGYQLVECPTSIRLSSTYLSKSITVKLEKNPLKCFYKNDKVAVDFG